MKDTKRQIEELISQMADGIIAPVEGWDRIRELKAEHFAQYNSQSWNSYVGKKFQQIIHAMLKGYATRLSEKEPAYVGLEVLTEGELNRHEVLKRKLSVTYGKYLLLPDVDSVIAWIDRSREWESKVLAVVSCKTSLRERIAQSCYWKLKLLSSDVTKNVKVFLATTDNDNDFSIGSSSSRYHGKHRNRVIAEHELDGVYILKDDFETGWESSKVKRIERVIDDMLALLKSRSP